MVRKSLAEFPSKRLAKDFIKEFKIPKPQVRGRKIRVFKESKEKARSFGVYSKK